MPEVADIEFMYPRQAASSDLAAWTRIDPGTPNDRDGVMVSNFSSNPLYLRYVSTGQSDPSGSLNTDADEVIPPGVTRHLLVGQRVAVWGLHAAVRTAGYTLRETR